MSVPGGLAVLLLSCIGNAELWVILMNRRHSLRYRHQVLRRLRTLHDAGVLLFPPFIFATAGFSESGLLRGGTFGELRLSLQFLLSLTFVGLIPFAYSVVRWQMRRMPKGLLDIRSVRHEPLATAATEAERASIRGTANSLLARLPGNEIFHLDVNQKRLRLPRHADNEVAGSSTGIIKLAHFSDVHMIGCPGQGYHQYVTEQLCKFKPDAFLFTGDLLDRQELVEWAVDSFSRMVAIAPGYFILGNHDWHLDHEEIRRRIAETGWKDLGEKCLTTQIGQQSVMIAGTESPWIGSDPEVDGQNGVDLRLLLSHSPDRRDFAVANDFDLMLCGHNHGGQVILPIVGPVYSPSKYGVRYSAGVFEYGNLLIHVSRGVAAKDTLRWNCCPEISLLELELNTNKTL